MTATPETNQRERPRLRIRYDSELRAAIQERLGLANVMQVPRFEKVVINMGVGAAVQSPSLLEGAVRDLPRSPGRSRW